VGEDTAALLLPAVAAGIGGGASADFRAAAFMVASQLAARAPLAPAFLDGAGPAPPRARLATCAEPNSIANSAGQAEEACRRLSRGRGRGVAGSGRCGHRPGGARLPMMSWIERARACPDDAPNSLYSLRQRCAPRPALPVAWGCPRGLRSVARRV